MTQDPSETWHNGAGVEMALYVAALRHAARVLLAQARPESPIEAVWRAGPILRLYREAMLIALKEFVAAGAAFQKEPTDAITLMQTDALRWLARRVVSIVNRSGRQREFVCEGVGSLAEFGELMDALEDRQPVRAAVYTPQAERASRVPPVWRGMELREFTRRLEAVLDLLAAHTGAAGGGTIQ